MSIHELVQQYASGDPVSPNTKSVTTRIDYRTYASLSALASEFGTSVSALLKSLTEVSVQEAVDSYNDLYSGGNFEAKYDAILENLERDL